MNTAPITEFENGLDEFHEVLEQLNVQAVSCARNSNQRMIREDNETLVGQVCLISNIYFWISLFPLPRTDVCFNRKPKG